jgi:hypothetical protein
MPQDHEDDARTLTALKRERLIAFLQELDLENRFGARLVERAWDYLILRNRDIADPDIRESFADLLREQGELLARARRLSGDPEALVGDDPHLAEFVEGLVAETAPLHPGVPELAARRRARQYADALPKIAAAIEASAKRGRPKKGQAPGDATKERAAALAALGFAGSDEAIRQARHRAKKKGVTSTK